MGNDLTSYTTYQSLQGTQMNQGQEASRLPITRKYGGGAGMDDHRRSSSSPPGAHPQMNIYIAPLQGSGRDHRGSGEQGL